MRHRLEKNLSSDRYQYTLGIAYMATALAMRYQASIEDTGLAGLLHNCAEEYDKKESLSAAEGSGIRFSAADMTMPQIWHAIIGSVVAGKRYDVAKPEIFPAVRWHATGRREMSLLEKIVFTTDYIEPNRNRADNLAKMHYLAFQDLDLCVYRITAGTLRYLISKRVRADQKTEEYYRWLEEVKKYGDR